MWLKARHFIQKVEDKYLILVKIENDSCSLLVTNVQKINNVIVHQVIIESGSISIGDDVFLKINTKRREKIAANHSSTHLLNQALRDVLGDMLNKKVL